MIDICNFIITLSFSKHFTQLFLLSTMKIWMGGRRKEDYKYQVDISEELNSFSSSHLLTDCRRSTVSPIVLQAVPTSCYSSLNIFTAYIACFLQVLWSSLVTLVKCNTHFGELLQKLKLNPENYLLRCENRAKSLSLTENLNWLISFLKHFQNMNRRRS